MTSTDCNIVSCLTDDAIWAHLEGDADIEVVDCIRTHCIKCTACFMAYAEGIDRLKLQNPKRYARFHNENLMVRKLELERYCKKLGIYIDINKIRNAEDYFKTFFKLAFKDAGPLFSKWWENIDPERRNMVIMELLQILEDNPENTE